MLTAEHVERVYRHVLASGCGPGTVAHLRRTISAALNAAARRGHILRNPVPLADMPRADDAVELEPYDAEEIGKVLTAARQRRNGVRWSLAFLGLRQGEALGVRWDDVDLDAGELLHPPHAHLAALAARLCPGRRGGDLRDTSRQLPATLRRRRASWPTQVQSRTPARWPSPHPSWPNCANSAAAKPPNASPQARSGTNEPSSSPTAPAGRCTAAPTPRTGSTWSRSPASDACGHTTADTPPPPRC